MVLVTKFEVTAATLELQGAKLEDMSVSENTAKLGAHSIIMQNLHEI